jgi:hypothetical protein
MDAGLLKVLGLYCWQNELVDEIYLEVLVPPVEIYGHSAVCYRLPIKGSTRE